jgi:3-demethoxyubiquinol 3-hydroxylase
VADATIAQAASPTGTALGDRILKVDHAGEHGAVNIYLAQAWVARWRAPEWVPLLREFRAHEEGHRARFGALLASRGRRRCRSYVLCGLGGWVLGFVTGLLGRPAIAATTEAVENVVLGHLREQMQALADSDRAACAAIATIVDEETAHRDTGAELGDPGAFWPRIVTPLVRVSTQAVIWTGMRL